MERPRSNPAPERGFFHPPRSRSSSPSVPPWVVLGAALCLPLLWGCGNGNGSGPPTGVEHGSVAGQVTDPAGGGVAGAELTLTRTGETSRTTSSSADGSFAFSEVPAGNWTLAIEAPTGWVLAPGQSAERSVTVQPGAAAQVGVALVPEPSTDGATVSGSVEHDGRGVADVLVILRDPDGGVSETTTGDDGGFHLQVDVPGALELEIRPPPYFELAPGEFAIRTVVVEPGASEAVTVGLRPVGGQQTIEVSLQGVSFSPAQVTASPGARIRWVNAESMTHTITPQAHDAWVSAEVHGPGDSFEVVLNNPGEYPYFCQPHNADGMAGTVVIQP